MTDVEGSLAYVRRFVEESSVLCWSDAEKCQLDFVGEGESECPSYFVFGGDLFDKGSHDELLSQMFVRFKQKYPDRVFLLMGNRDINKLRLTSELHESELSRPLESVPSIPGMEETSYLQYLTTLAENRKLPLLDLDSQAQRLHYYYEKTLGCPDTFEHHREAISRKLGRQASDSEVVDYVLEANTPTGWLLQYLRAAQIGVILGDILFVHGAATHRNMHFIPSLEVRYVHARGDESTVPGQRHPDGYSVQAWVHNLNQFAQHSLDDFEDRPLWRTTEGGVRRRGGEALMAWQSRPASVYQTPVVDSYLDRGELLPISLDTVSHLLAHGITRVCVGHKPAGDVPLTIKLAGGLEIIVGDLSHSDHRSPDHRGCAVAEVLLYTGSLPTMIHGTTRDGRHYRSSHPLIGTRTEDGYFVKALLEEENQFVLVCTSNRKEACRLCPVDDLVSSPIDPVVTN